MANIEESLAQLQQIQGFIAAAVAHSESGMTFGTVGGGSDFDIDIAAAANTEVVKAKNKAMKALGISGNIEDILITLTPQYHIVRPLDNDPAIFVYIALNRSSANLALARYKLAEVCKSLTL